MMIRHPGLIYLLPFALPLLALAQPTRPPAALQASGRGMSHPAGHRLFLARPSASAPLQIPINSRAQGADGSIYTLTGTLSLQIDAPPPPVDPLTITGLAIAPNTIAGGAGATGTVTLNRSPGQAVLIALTAEKGLTVDPSVTIQPGQTAGTFGVKSSAVATGTWLSVTASYNGQSRLASVFVQGAVRPPGDAPPVIGMVLNPDGSPLVMPQWGQEARIRGVGFGSAAGSVRWQGGSVPVVSWSDAEVRVRLPLPAISGAQEFSVTKPDGTYSDVLIPGLVPGVVR